MDRDNEKLENCIPEPNRKLPDGRAREVNVFRKHFSFAPANILPCSEIAINVFIL